MMKPECGATAGTFKFKGREFVTAPADGTGGYRECRA
jgi:hypothetical protein